MPSSASRSSSSAYFLELFLVLFECRSSAEGLGRACESLDLAFDVLAGRDGELDLVTGGELELVERVDVGGIRDRDLQDVPVERVRQGDQPLEHMQRDRPGSIIGDAGRMNVDQRQVVARRERLRDHHAVGEPLVDEGLGEGRGFALSRTKARRSGGSSPVASMMSATSSASGFT